MKIVRYHVKRLKNPDRLKITKKIGKKIIEIIEDTIENDIMELLYTILGHEKFVIEIMVSEEDINSF